ncbi:hypothetical protein AVEN_184395-1 [Araneus ventricosus]|uniref:Uncharacterized protein n=1 Tax=Araneus ventricosus TaxID=182803 RepID=A0A4Y2BFG2_ARAVE|nr:hypothetical protein AVEN_184395-1 [Araneus ventricosus]
MSQRSYIHFHELKWLMVKAEDKTPFAFLQLEIKEQENGRKCLFYPDDLLRNVLNQAVMEQESLSKPKCFRNFLFFLSEGFPSAIFSPTSSCKVAKLVLTIIRD